MQADKQTSSPVPPGRDSHEDAMRRQVMAAVSLVTSGAALAVCAYLFFFTAHPADALAPGLIFLSAVIGHGMVRTGRDRYAPHLLVAAVLAAATL
ncbi:MAG: hypothetical protein EP306_06035, partial [Burkholderiales bacterium]